MRITTSLIIALALTLFYMNVQWSYTAKDIEACAYARGVQNYAKSMRNIYLSPEVDIDDIPVWSIGKGDYQACERVGKRLE